MVLMVPQENKENKVYLENKGQLVIQDKEVLLALEEMMAPQDNRVQRVILDNKVKMDLMV